MSIARDMELSTGQGNMLDGWMEFAHKLYSKDHIRYHTEIIHPDEMTFLDRSADYWSRAISKGVGNFVRQNNLDYRDNMVAFQRKRALETERVAKGKVEEEKESKKMKEVLVGMQR